MRIWKRLLGTALCLCAAVCVMSVSASAAEHSNHPICGDITKCTNPDHSENHGDAVEWIKVMKTDVTGGELKLTAGNSYYLGEDIEVKWDITINGTVNLCLNGHSITKTSESDTFAGVIKVESGSSFTLCDCNGSGAGNGKITHKEGVTGRGVLVGSSEPKQASFIMYGGTISGNRINGQDGAGVRVQNASFKMYGGTITDNHVEKMSNDGGGGVAVSTSGKFIMYDGEISRNTSNGDCGGVAVVGSSFQMYGGTISGNIATGDGGGVGLWNDSFRLSGGSIINNNATGSGGGVYFKGDTFNVFGAVNITGNVVGSSPNNVYLPDGKTITVAGALTGNDKIGVTTENTPDNSKYVQIASGNKDNADPDKFRYENDGAIAVSAVVNDSTATLVACQHNWSDEWEKDTYNHWHVCSLCNGKKDVSAHNYDQKVTGESYKASDATCTSPALYHWSCVCGAEGADTFGSGEKNPDKHSGALGGWQSNEDKHWKEYTCCHVRMDEGDHQWDEGEVTTAATCTTAGEKTYTCTVCNRTKTETLAALGHNYGEPAYVWNGKSCTAERVCSRDGSHKETETVTAAVTVTQNRSCLLDELSTYTASFKNAAFTKQTQENVVTANKLGHDFENGTWQSDGDHHWKKCSRCDVTDEASKAPHSGGTATCQAKAVCETCGTAYGALDANNHSGVLGVWQSNENNHWKEYSCCKVHADVGSHHWDEGRETKSPTCTEAGVKTFTCSQCNNAKTEPIPALDHQWSEWVVTTPATETTEGSETRTCQRDNTHTETRSIPKLNHTHTMVHHSAVDADCGKGTPGNIEYWVCSGCKKVFSDKDGAHEINLENTVIPPDHNPSTAWSFDESSHWYECKKCKEKLDFAAHDYDDDSDTDCNICNYTRVIIPPHSHVLEQVPAVPATCVSAGNTEHYRCAACGERFKDGGGNEPVTEDAVKIPPLGHDWQEASCETPKFCKRDGCGVTDGAALGHDWGRYIVTMAATQESEGVETRTCQRNSNHTQTRPIPKLPASTYGVSGEVNESGGNPAVGAVVKLVLGDRQIASTTTDDKGKYSFEKVVPGVYNLVAEKDGIIMTVKVTVISKDVRVSTITMPQGKTNSVVEVKSDDSAETVEAVVGNLEKVFERPGNGKPFTVEDQTVVDGGGSVEIKLTVTKTDEDETSAAIRQELPANTKVGVRLELGVDKTVTPKNGSPQSTPVNNTDILLETMIRLPAPLQGKDSYTVYRLHGRDVHALTAQKNTDGEFIEVSHDRTAITIHAKLYSEYVIAYQERGETGGNGGNTGGNGGNGGNGNGGGHDDNDDGYTPPSVPARPETHTGYRACRRDDTCPIWPFADAAPTAWYHDGVHYCIEKGLMHGISADKFLPDGSVTRAQLAAILWRLEGNPAPVSTAGFSDVADGAWYAGAVRWAADSGVVRGYADGRFRPNDAVTREQMAALLYRFAGYKGYDVGIGGDTDLLRFTDGAAVGGYAVPAMRWACGSGLMTGTQRDGGMALAPRDTTTRAQTATLLTRFQSAFAKEP